MPCRSWKNTLESTWDWKHKLVNLYSLWAGFCFFLAGRWAISLHFFCGCTAREVLFLSADCDGVEGFVAVWLFTCFVTNCLLFLLPFHDLLSHCNFVLCFVSFLAFSFHLYRHVLVPRVVFCARGFFWLCFFSESTPPANRTLPARCRSPHRNT